MTSVSGLKKPSTSGLQLVKEDPVWGIRGALTPSPKLVSGTLVKVTLAKYYFQGPEIIFPLN